MGLAAIIRSGINKARKEAGDLIVTATLQRRNGSTYVGGVNTPVYVPKDVEGVYDQIKDHEINGSSVQTSDIRIMLFIDTQDQVPDTTCLMTVDNVNYQVIAALPVYAGTSAVACMVQLRK